MEWSNQKVEALVGLSTRMVFCVLLIVLLSLALSQNATSAPACMEFSEAKPVIPDDSQSSEKNDSETSYRAARVHERAVRNRMEAVRNHIVAAPIVPKKNGKHTHPQAAIRMIEVGPNDPQVLDLVDRSMGSGNIFSVYSLSLMSAIADGEWPASLTERVKSQFELYEVKQLLGGGTENHVLMKRASSILLGEQFPNATTSFGMKGSAVAAAGKEFLKRNGKALFTYSLSEHLSPTYLAVHTGVLSGLHSYSKDKEVRLMAGAMLEYLLAELAVNQLENTVVPARRYKSVWKGYDIQGTIPKTGTQWVSWLFFGSDRSLLDSSGNFLGNAKPGVSYERNMYLHAVSDWMPNQLVRNVGAKVGIQPYSMQQSVANFACMEQSHVNGIGKQGPAENPDCNPLHEAREIYVTDDYLLGAATVADIYYDISEIDADHFGAVWRADDQHNSIRIAHPHFFWNYPLKDDDKWGDEDWSGYSPFLFAALNKNIYLGIYDLTLPDPYIGKKTGRKAQHAYRNTSVHQAIYVYVPDGMELVKVTNDGRYYFQDGEVYALVRPLVPEAVRKESSIHQGYSRLKLSGSVAGAYLIMGSKREYHSINGFIDYTAKASFDTTELFSQLKAAYVHPDGTSLTVASPGRTGRYPVVERNGSPVEFYSWPELSSPYLSRSNRVLGVYDGTTGFSIDWSGELPVYEALVGQ